MRLIQQKQDSKDNEVNRVNVEAVYGKAESDVVLELNLAIGVEDHDEEEQELPRQRPPDRRIE